VKTIKRGEVLRMSAGEIEVREGCLWVTQERDNEDYIVRKGDVMRFGAGAIVSALKAALVDIRPIPAT